MRLSSSRASLSLVLLLAGCRSSAAPYDFDLERIRGSAPATAGGVTLFLHEFFDPRLERAARAAVTGAFQSVDTVAGGSMPPGIVLVPDVKDVVQVPSGGGWFTSVHLEWRVYRDGSLVASRTIDASASKPRSGAFGGGSSARRTTEQALEEAFVLSRPALQQMLAGSGG